MKTSKQNQTGAGNIVNVVLDKVPADKLATYFKTHEVTVERLAGVFFDEKTSIATVAWLNGNLNQNDKLIRAFAKPEFPALLAFQNVDGNISFDAETATPINAKAWNVLVDQMAKLTDKTGKPITEFYGVGYGGIQARTYFRTNVGNTIVDMGEYKIANIRHDAHAGRYYALRTDAMRLGVELVTIKDKDFHGNVMAPWATVGKLDVPVMGLYKLGYQDKKLTAIANHRENFRRQMSVATSVVTDDIDWSDGYLAFYTVIGTLGAETDRFVGYRKNHLGEIEIVIDYVDDVKTPLIAD